MQKNKFKAEQKYFFIFFQKPPMSSMDSQKLTGSY
jgi:hypothetical protein